MSDQIKMNSFSRQKLIISRLKAAKSPVTGSEFAKETNVSRQVIVQDISILKAKNKPIVATSQGYIYLNDEQKDDLHQKVIVCNHTPGQTAEELYLIVDHGVTVKDVKVEHAVYGDLTASVRVSNRKEVEQFVKKIKETNAAYLASLTGGIHLHTLEADSLSKIESACADLKKAGIMI